jgi:hypothetical protein
MVANVGNTILGTFNAVQNASVNRERIAKARLDREITQDAFMKQQGYDRAKKFEAYAIRNGYTSAGSQDFDFNKMGADLYSDDPARRQIAEQGYLMLGNEVQGENAPFTFKQITRDSNGNLAFSGSYKDSDEIAVATETGDKDPNGKVQTLDLDTLNRNANLVFRNVVRPRLYNDSLGAEMQAVGDMLPILQQAAAQTGNTGIVRAGFGAVANSPEGEKAQTAKAVIEDITGKPYELPEARKAEVREDAGDREYMGFGKVRSVARFDRLKDELTSLREQDNLSSIQQRRAKFLENHVPQLRAELQVELDELQNQRAAAVSSSKQETMDPKFWEAREKAARGAIWPDAADLMPPAEQKFAREIKALEDKLGITEEFANMAPVVDKVDTVIAGDGKNIQAAQEAGALTFTREEERAVAEDAKRAGVTTPQDIPKLPVRQRHAFIAVLTSRYVGKGEKEKEIYSALMNYATTGDPTMSGENASTIANSRRLAANQAQTNRDKAGDEVAAAQDKYVKPVIESVISPDGELLAWDDIENIQPVLTALNGVQSVATAVPGSAKAIGADSVLLQTTLLPILSYAKMKDDTGFIDDIADIARDPAGVPIGDLASRIRIDYGKNGMPSSINFINTSTDDLFEESLSWSELTKVIGGAAQGKLLRLDQVMKAANANQGE